jgi:hypothetical protein
MAFVWIVTTGNSDVKLNSDVGWNDFRGSKNNQLKPCQKSFSSLTEEDNSLFSLPARAMGIIYGDTWETHKQYFRFPLLEEFSRKLKDQGKLPDRIIVLLSNQEEIFLEDSEDPRYDRCEDSPYWRDTCCLKSILKHYFDQVFGEEKTDFIDLKPQTKDQGLDNWDSALQLVQEQFKKIGFEESDSIFVSHQAGTPAISSAVQFASLAQFEDQVTFLISNERDTDLTKFLPSSAYLRGLKRTQAEKMLKNYDYAGVSNLISDYLDPDIKCLLEAAIQWNFAHFTRDGSLIKEGKKSKNEGFVEKLSKHHKFTKLITERTGDAKWWWTAYEAAYLGVIRLRQGNTVEAVFQSFRSVEGLLKSWAEQIYPGELASTKHPKWQENIRWNRKLRSYGEDLYTFLDMKREIRKDQNLDIWIFGNVVIGRRNELFHDIKGLNDREDVFEVWRSSNEKKWKEKPEEQWKTRIVNCLNFIVGEDLEEGFKSLEDASLMAKVHDELVNAIAAL